MEAASSAYVTLIETFELTCPFEEFEALVTAIVPRLEREGVSALASMQFYAGENPSEVGAVIRFSDSRQFSAHLQMIQSWPEFTRFSESVRLKDIRVFGTLPAELEAFIRKFNGTLSKFERPIVGFVRAHEGVR